MTCSIWLGSAWTTLDCGGSVTVQLDVFADHAPQQIREIVQDSAEVERARDAAPACG